MESDTIPGTETAGASCGHSLTVFFHRENGGDKDGNADAVRYTNFNGAIVFASGSHQFAWALDRLLGHTWDDPRVRRSTRAAVHAERARCDDEVSSRSRCASSPVSSAGE